MEFFFSRFAEATPDGVHKTQNPPCVTGLSHLTAYMHLLHNSPGSACAENEASLCNSFPGPILPEYTYTPTHLHTYTSTLVHLRMT